MNAIQLQKPTGEPVNIFYCSNCGKISNNKEFSDRCCFCLGCKSKLTEEEIKNNQNYCSACQEKRRVEGEERIFNNRTKINWCDYSDPVFYNDRFYSDVNELIDDLIGYDEDFPKYVYSSQILNLKITTKDILELIYGKAEEFENFEFEPDEESLKELDLALNKFFILNEKELKYYIENDSTLIIMPTKEEILEKEN